MFRHEKTMFTLTVLEILLFEGRSVILPTNGFEGAKELKVGWYFDPHSGLQEGKGLINVLLVRFLPYCEKQGTPLH